LLQVAEGAMDQIGNMLTRLKELATQAASANAGANLDKISAEANKLVDEIDRIAQSTEYADTKLINGTYGVTYNAATTALTQSSNGYSGITGMQASKTYTITSTLTGTVGTMTVSSSGIGGATDVETVYFTPPTSGSGGTKDVFFTQTGLTVTVTEDFDSDLDGAVTAGSSGSSSFQIGAENDSNNRVSFTLGNVRKSSSGLNVESISLSSAAGAQSALDIIDTAISSLNSERGKIGAYMNRLSYASANLSSTIENVTASESVIRDVDMAAEMVTFTKNQILLQAGTAMLAQANMAPQQVLALFG
jgi:flagellin